MDRRAGSSSMHQSSKSGETVWRKRRTKRACNHCRFKRLKCSRMPDTEKCLNCVAYNRVCETTEDSDRASARSRAASLTDDSLSPQLGGAAVQPRSQPFELEEDWSPNPEDKPAGPEEPRTNAIIYASRGQPPSFDIGESVAAKVTSHDHLTHKLNAYLGPLLTGLPETFLTAKPMKHEPWVPSRQAIETYTTAFFTNVAPFYPVIDESNFRHRVDQFFEQRRQRDSFTILMKLVICIGEKCCRRKIDAAVAEEVQKLQANIFSELMPVMILTLSIGKVESAQIMTLIILYCLQVKSFAAASTYCKLAARLCYANTYLAPTRDWTKEDLDLHGRVMWSVFILESNSAVVQLLEQPILSIIHLRRLDEQTMSKHPIFCYRFRLAHLANRFVAIGMTSASAANYLTSWTEVFRATEEWQASIPDQWKPGQEVEVKDTEMHLVLLMHLEYHSLLCRMATALCAAGSVAEAEQAFDEHPESCIRDRIALGTLHGRRLLETVNAMADSAHLEPNGSCWIHSQRILDAFSWVYAHIRKCPDDAQSASDTQLLLNASVHYKQHSPRTKVNANIQSLLLEIYRATAEVIKEVHLSRTRSSTTTDTDMDENEQIGEHANAQMTQHSSTYQSPQQQSFQSGSAMNSHPLAAAGPGMQWSPQNYGLNSMQDQAPNMPPNMSQHMAGTQFGNPQMDLTGLDESMNPIMGLYWPPST